MAARREIPAAWQRLVIGAAALVCLLAAGVMFAGWLPVTTDGVAGQFLRMGLVLGVLWLAWPDALRPQSLVFIASLLVLVLVLVRFPRVFPFVAGALLVLTFLGSRFLRRRV